MKKLDQNFYLFCQCEYLCQQAAPSPQGDGQLTDKGVQDESSEPFVVLYKGFEIWYNIGVKRVLEEQVCLRKEAESKINLRW